MPEEKLDLTPSPRILDVIADVDMTVEECLAELIDNALDEIDAAQREDPGFEGRVEIELPCGAKVTSESAITVTDTGRGMSVEQMRHALRAGSSGNSRYGSLGLFGMGFNVATGRLGFVTTVKSGRPQDENWIVAVIDIQAMGSHDSFQVPITTEPKSIGEHGTSISVSSLRSDTVKRLRWPGIANRVRTRLGQTYSYMLRSVAGTDISGADVIGGLGLDLTLNGSSVDPYIPCIWSPERSVAYKGQDVPAVTTVCHELKPAFACMECGHWHSEVIESLDHCLECQSDRIELRDRSIRGWLGIQRYDDTSDFGITLLRQGRTIVHLDKALFEWTNPDSGDKVVEYPVELGRGRIVGELHLDHLPVNYRKTDFGRDSAAWNTVRERVRGDGPLLEKLAKQLDYPPNTSELGMLFHAYRRYDAGYRYLVPGDGERAMAEQARRWGESFRKGLAAYQSDEMWWKHVVNHEKIKSGNSGDGDDDDEIDDLLPSGGSAGDNPTGGDSTNESEDGSAAGDDEAPVLETRDERLSRYRSNGRVVPQLDGTEIVIPGGSRTIKVTVYTTSGVELVEGGDKYSTANLEAGVVELFIDESHPLLANYGWNPVDVAAMVLHDAAASYLRYEGRAGSFIEGVLEQVGDRRIDAATVRQSATGLLDRIRETSIPLVKSDPAGIWAKLSNTAKAQTQKFAALDASVNWNALEATGGYAEFLSPRAFEDLISEVPELMLDNGIFTSSYGSWQDESIREERISHLTSLVRDLERTLTVTDHLSARELLRLSIGLESLSLMVVDRSVG
ncbi:ATP-binding protein [Dietzia maris]